MILSLNPDPEDFPGFFAPDSVPSDTQRQRYDGYLFKATSVSIDGNSATATVQFEDLSTHTVVGEQEWTAVKIGADWKLKTAPPP
ncbi:MAG TPA: hypothetical protein VMY42_09500 [Thermoguttaceae bacterium]|nr:hypothetical protein [Thermoguttaceae bacterium]